MFDKVLFLDYSNKSELTEGEIVFALSNHTEYFPVFQFDSVKKFLINLFVALYNDCPIILVDNDFNQNEIIKLGIEDKINVSERIAEKADLNQNDWLTRIQDSNSEITLFTSGTTGLPKKVVHSVKSLTRMLRTGKAYCQDKWVLAYNPTHMAGLQVLFQALFNKNPILNVFGSSLEDTIKAFYKFKPTHISATPTFYRILLSTNNTFNSLQRVTLGGEKSNNDLHQKLKTIFPNAKINNIYATTELGPLLVSNGEVFEVLNGLESKIKTGKDGELLIHTSLLNLGISNMWYNTGDLVDVVNSTPLRFTFKSRKTEMINTGGYKVNPNEVEAVLNAHPQIENSRVFGKPNSILGHIICAEVVLASSNIFDSKTIKKYLAENLQDFKIPRIIKPVKGLKLTRTGKLSRN